MMGSIAEQKDIKRGPLDILLPFPPSANTYWRYAQFKNMKYPMFMISKKGREYTSHVTRVIQQNNLVGAFFNGEYLQVEIELFPPDLRKRDIDNYNKGLFDSLTKAKYWKDDKQVKKLIVEMKEKRKGGYIHVVISQLEGFEPKQHRIEFPVF